MTAIRALNPNGCQLSEVNSQRSENLSFALRPEQSAANVASQFMQPVSLYGPGFGPPVGRPFTASFGARFEW